MSNITDKIALGAIQHGGTVAQPATPTAPTDGGTVAADERPQAHKNALDRWDEYADRFDTLPQTAVTGFAQVDTALKVTGLATLGAGSGVGKTSLALNFLCNRIERKLSTIMVTLEMSAPEILQRVAAILITKKLKESPRTASQRVRCNDVTSQHIRSISRIETADKVKIMQYLTLIEYADTENETGDFDSLGLKLDIDTIRQQRKDRGEDSTDILIIIDSLNLITAEGNDERRAVNQAIRKLSRFAKSNGVTILLIAQLTKESVTKGAIKEIDPALDTDFTPLLYDFRESALIPYLSDSCFFLIGDKGNDPQDNAPTVWLVSSKNRRAAINSKVAFTFEKDTFLFTENQ